MGEAFLVTKPSGVALRALNYTPEVERLRARRGSDATILGSLVSSMGPAYGSVFVRIDCERQHGVELITQSDMFAAEPHGRIIRRDSMARAERHLVTRWQVLLAGAGTLGENELYGRAIIADARLEGRYVGPHAMVLTFKEPEDDQSLFAYAFFLTRVGLKAIRATSFGTKILGLRKDLLADLPVPIPPTGIRRRVAAAIRCCVEQREVYLRELRLARRVFDVLPEVRDAYAQRGTHRAHAVLWGGEFPTLRAWNFASMGDGLSLLRRRWTGRLGDAVVSGGLFKGERMTRISCDPPYGVELLSQRDVFAIRPCPRRIQRPHGHALEVDQSMLLLASRGQMNEGALFGRVERALHMPGGTIVTEDVTRIRPRDGLAEGLYAFLSTSLGLALLRSTAYGTSIPGMRFDLLEHLPIPDAHVMAQAKPHVDAATRARRSSAEAEMEAIRIVEEEVLPAWLA